MKLKTLLSDIDAVEILGEIDVNAQRLHCDSRQVRPGDIFVAIRGEKTDGHQFIEQAVENGASIVVCEDEVGNFQSATVVRVSDSRKTLAHLAANFHSRPSEKMCAIGITGTNGKTTTSYLIAAILEAAGIPTGVIGTLAYRMGHRELPALNTTPSADELQLLLTQMLQAGMKAVTIEVSSHSLAQHRVDEMAWDAAVFTNLTRDHLDYHKDMESYFQAKKILFQQIGRGSKKAVAILNQDDPRSEDLRGALQKDVRLVTYGFSSSADVRAEIMADALTIEKSRFTLIVQGQKIEISTLLCGAHNIFNCLAAAATGFALGHNLETIRKGIESVKNIPGRLERLEGFQTFAVIIDYAHTDDALRRVLNALRSFTRGRLITVFGCGGNRDHSKRSLMGEAACELSDINILTTDNPRFEDPSAIVKEIAAGFKSRNNYQIVLDRRAAIRAALMTAREGDIVLLAGKGHETYQDVRGVRSPFDDREAASEILRDLLSKTAGREALWKN